MKRPWCVWIHNWAIQLKHSHKSFHLVCVCACVFLYFILFNGRPQLEMVFKKSKQSIGHLSKKWKLIPYCKEEALSGFAAKPKTFLVLVPCNVYFMINIFPVSCLKVKFIEAIWCWSFFFCFFSVFSLSFVRFSCAHGTPSRIPLIALNQRTTKCRDFNDDNRKQHQQQQHHDNIDPYDGRIVDNVNNIDYSTVIAAAAAAAATTSTTAMSNNGSGGGRAGDADDAPSETQVPILVIVSILALYICIGTMIFSVWENWSFIDGAYFCFVTLSTIGFGADLVPRKTFQGPDLQLFACCTYLIVGLILVTMSFTLLESQLMWRCKRIAMRFQRNAPEWSTTMVQSSSV